MSHASKSKKSYTAEFREKAVRLVAEHGYTIDQVATQLGCCRESVRRWYEAKKDKAEPEEARRMELEKSENKRLRQEVARLTMENEILKKATAYFAKEIM
jgi:transposase